MACRQSRQGCIISSLSCSTPRQPPESPPPPLPFGSQITSQASPSGTSALPEGREAKAVSEHQKAADTHTAKALSWPRMQWNVRKENAVS